MLRSSLRLVLALFLGLLWCAEAVAQVKVQLLFSTEADQAKATENFYTLALRPNVDTPFFVFLRNEAIDNEELQLTVSCRNGAQTNILNQQDLKINGRSTVPVTIKLEKETSINDARELIFSLRDKRDKDNKEVLRKAIKLTIMKPIDYLEFEQALDEKGQLLVTITRKKDFRGPDCRLELDCTALRNLIPGQEFTGSLVDTITATDKPVAVLALQQLKFKKNVSDTGYLAIKVDGIPRAKVIVTDMQPGKPLMNLTDRNVIRVIGSPYCKPDPKSPYEVRIEVDNVEVEQAQIRLSFDRTGSGTTVSRLFTSIRKEDIVFSSSEKGLFSIKPMVQDWTHKIVSEGLNGKRLFKAELLDRSFTPLNKTSNTEFAVVFSKDPPKNAKISFQETKTNYQPGEKVVASANADDITGITKAFFFLGDIAPKEPEKQIAATETNQGWQANVILPDQKGRVKLGVVMENGIGLSSTHVMDVFIEDPAMKEAKDKLASISGTVVQGDRAQRGLTVDLYDDKKALVKSTKTDDAGKFSFTELNPGSYLLICQREDSAQDRKVVIVAKGGNATATLSLER